MKFVFYPSQHKFAEKNSKNLKNSKDGQMPPFRPLHNPHDSSQTPSRPLRGKKKYFLVKIH